MIIITAQITPLPRPMPAGMFDPMPEVIATFDDGSRKSFFTFHPSEITFRGSKFIGLTEEEAHRLFQDRDTTCLRS